MIHQRGDQSIGSRQTVHKATTFSLSIASLAPEGGNSFVELFSAHNNGVWSLHGHGAWNTLFQRPSCTRDGHFTKCSLGMLLTIRQFSKPRSSYFHQSNRWRLSQLSEYFRIYFECILRVCLILEVYNTPQYRKGR